MSEPKSDLKAVEAFYQSVLGSLPHLPTELLLSAVEERLSPREQGRVDDHLGACEYCRQDFKRCVALPNSSQVLLGLP